MIAAMVLDLKQIGMRPEHGDRLRIAFQPARGDEDRRGNTLPHQHIEDPPVDLARTGVERQRHPRRLAVVVLEAETRLHEAGRLPGGIGMGGQRGEREEDEQDATHEGTG